VTSCADVVDIAPHIVAEFGRFAKNPAAPQAAKVTFMKSGERPIMPQVARAQFSIIFERVSSASLVFGMSKERPTGSPVEGEAKVMTSRNSASCCMS
jgi:hypothetical protein